MAALWGHDEAEGLVAGLELPGSGDAYVMNHIKRSMPASYFARVHTNSRVNRFFGGAPQLEEMPDEDRAKLRCIFGEKVTFELASWLANDTPEFCVTLADPVTLFLGQHIERLQKNDGADLEELIDAPQIDNPVCRAIAMQLDDVDFGAAPPDLDLVQNVLKRVQFVCVVDHLSVQAANLFQHMEIPLCAEPDPTILDWDLFGVTDAQVDTLLSRHHADAALFDAALMGYGETEHVAQNPFGFEPDLLAEDVAFARDAMSDYSTVLTRAYRDLLETIESQHRVEAFLVMLEHGSVDHVVAPEIFFDLFDELELLEKLSTTPKAKSKLNAASYALRNLRLPHVAERYAEAALELNPDSAPAKRLLARVRDAA